MSTTPISTPTTPISTPTTESLIEDFESLLGMAMFFVPATAPAAPYVLAGLPSITHQVMSAASTSDPTTQAAIITASALGTAKVVDAMSTGGQKSTLDALTASDAQGNSLISLAVGKIMNLVQGIAGSVPALEVAPAPTPAQPQPTTPPTPMDLAPPTGPAITPPPSDPTGG